MNTFAYTQLEEGEIIVLGIVTSSSSGAFSFSAGGVPRAQGATASMGQTGVTNRRVIVEQIGAPERTRIIANAEVRRVHLKHDKFGAKITKIETNRNQSLDLDLGGLTPLEESRLNEIFPHAEIKGQKHLPGSVSALPRPAVAPPVRRPLPSKPPRVPTGAPAPSAPRKTILSDPDVKSLDDLTRHYPLPAGYAYQQTNAGEFVVVRSSDGAQFTFLVEEGLLAFDVPAPDKPGRKVTVEVFKQ